MKILKNNETLDTESIGYSKELVCNCSDLPVRHIHIKGAWKYGERTKEGWKENKLND